MTVQMIKNLENKTEKKQESINKDLEELKKKHTETNNTITKIKNTVEGIKMVGITSEEQNKVKRMKITEDSLRDLWDNIKCTILKFSPTWKRK